MEAEQYSKELIAFDSVSTRSNVPISDHVEAHLKRIDFETERIEYTDPHNVRKVNVVGKKGVGRGGIAYFGHTDVVPADAWFSDEHGPFSPAISNGRLYGRGACDMKGSIACILSAAERFSLWELKQPIYVTCTADEEIGYAGAERVVARSELYREMVQGESRGVIGEPTRLEVVYAHKGTYGCVAIASGEAAHSSSRAGKNANLAMIPFLVEMKKIHDETESDPQWQNDEFDPPTVSWNIGINDFNTAVNIKSPRSVCTIYFRPMPGQDADHLLERARQAAERFGLEFEVLWRKPPMHVDPASAYVREMLDLAGKSVPLTVSYGTDGATLTEMKRLVLFGPGDIAQAHTSDEWISLEQLREGTDRFAGLISRWCM